jgi:glyoxylase I family protein
LEKSTDFYSRVLDLPVKFRFHKDGSFFGAYFEAGNRTYVEVFQSSDDLPDRSHIVHFCLEVDDLESAVSDLRAKGFEVSDPKLGADESWQAWIADPDGVNIELHEYTERSSQMTGSDVTLG